MKKDQRERLEGLLKNFITESSDYIDSKIAPDRSKGYSYYYGDLPAPKKNQPSIVKKVVFEKIQAALPQIKEPFLSGRDVVKFSPFNANDGYGSCIASSVVNKILKTDNNIDTIYEQVILDGLIAKSGTIKVYWEDKEEEYEESFEGLSLAAVDMLLEQESNDELEVKDLEEVLPVFDLNRIIAGIPPEVFLSLYPAGPNELSAKATSWETLISEVPLAEEDIRKMMTAGTTYKGIIERKVDTSTVKIKNVAPENFLVDESATDIENAVFVAERDRVTISDLKQMGFDQALIDEVSESSTNSNGDIGDVQYARNLFDNTDNQQYRVSDDESQKFVDLYECYVETALVENSSDKTMGKSAKLYQMYYANGILLEFEEVDCKPFFSWCPLTVAHKMFGQSMAETLFEQQDSATYALRGALQYLAFSTNPRYKAMPGTEYNLAAFQANLPGSVVPINKGDLTPFQYPMLDQGLFQLMGTISDDADGVSGVSALSAGLDSDALRSNVAGSTVQLQMSAGTKRVKNYARNLATQCIKPAYAYVYELFRKNSTKNITVQINGRDVEVNPKSLPQRKSLDVDYSLGKNDQIEHAMALLQMKQRIESNPTLSKMQSTNQMYQLETDIMASSGVYDASRYIGNPTTSAKEVDPLAAQQLKLQQDQLDFVKTQEDNKKLQLVYNTKKLIIEEYKVKADYILKKQELEHKMRTDADKANNADEKLRFEQEKAADEQDLNELELELQALKATGELELKNNP